MNGPTDFIGLLDRLLAGGVEFILVGGVAGNVHGSARATYDIDVVYRRSPENLARLVETVAPLQPYLRGAPLGLPFVFDLDTLQRGLNVTLTTSLGDLDLLGEVVGGGTYEQLVQQSEVIDLSGRACRCATIDG